MIEDCRYILYLKLNRYQPRSAALYDFIKLSRSIISKPPLSYPIVSIAHLIISGLPSHMNSYLSFSILLLFDLVGLVKTKEHI